MFKKFLKDESGATAIEYTLIAAAMAIALLAIMPIITGALNTEFGVIATKVTSYK